MTHSQQEVAAILKEADKHRRYADKLERIAKSKRRNGFTSTASVDVGYHINKGAAHAELLHRSLVSQSRYRSRRHRSLSYAPEHERIHHTPHSYVDEVVDHHQERFEHHKDALTKSFGDSQKAHKAILDKHRQSFRGAPVAALLKATQSR